MMKRTAIVAATSAVTLMTAGAALAGTFRTISVDGGFSDWDGVPTLTFDPAADGDPIDYATVQLANDATNLYLRVTYHTPVNPNVGPSTFLAFDTDNNVATGFDVYGLGVVGSEAGFQNDFGFDQRTGYNVGGLMGSAAISPVDFGNPANAFTSQEYSIPRSLAFTTGGQPVFGNSFTLMLWTDSGIIADTTAAIPYTFGVLTTGWANDASGDYNVGGNWSSGSVPNGVGAVAEFRNAITSAQTVYSNTNITAGTLTFDNANTYVLTGAGSLTLDTAGGNAQINVLQGSHKINLPTRLNKTTVADVAAGATLTIADPLTLANGSALNKTGAGTMEIISTVTTTAAATLQTSAGTTNLRMDAGTGTTLKSSGGTTGVFTTQRVAAVQIDGGTVSISSAGAPRVIRTNSLSLSGAGKLNIGDNGLIVQYSGTSPIETIRAAILGGYNNGVWNGNGITTTASTSGRGIGYANASQVGSPTSFMGEGFTGSAVLVRYTLLGDTNLDGTVGFDDLLSLAQAYGQTSNQRWINGDSNYDAAVGFDDLLALSQNYSASLLSDSQAAALASAGGASFAADLALAQSIVPEPAGLAVAGLASMLLRRRRANG